MPSIQFLTTKVLTPNTHAIIYPLLKWKKNINHEIGKLEINRGELQQNSDIIIIDSKYHKNWWLDKSLGEKAIIDDLKKLKKKCNKLVYYDTTDSTGCIQKEVFGSVNEYWKGQTLLNKNEYKKNYHSGRIYTDYIKNKFYSKKNFEYEWEQINQNDIKRIKTAWNSSLTDYRFLRRRLAIFASRYEINMLMANNLKIKQFNHPRKIQISCRVFSKYNNELISWQREKAKKLLSKICKTELIPKRMYHKELLDARITFSPFGWGEICYRDFEAIMSGSLLLKPSMDHVETWPNLYLKNKTYIPCDWDLNNLIDIIDNFDKINSKDIIENSRNLYNLYLDKKSGKYEFIKRLKVLINDLLMP